jgi:hypothetical protein
MLKIPAVLLLAISPFAILNAALADSSSPILYIGDSITFGYFGGIIDTALRQISTQVTTEASCGSSPSNWLPQPGANPPAYAKTICGFWKKTPTDEFRTKKDPATGKQEPYNTPQIAQELATIHPKITIVQLGTNIAVTKNPLSSFNTVRQMMQDIKNAGSACIWIGPPSANSPAIPAANLNITDQMISDEAGKQGCYYVHTVTFTKAPPYGDGIHPYPPLAKDWADDVLKRIDSTLKQDINAQAR